MLLIIVRHGQTEENAKHIIQGQSIQGQLTEKGRMQVESIAAKLKDTKIDVIFSSDLKRAKDTAAIIARFHGVPVHYSRELRELNHGAFEGRNLNEYFKAQKASGLSVSEFRPDGGESYVDLRNRMRAFVRQLYGEYPNATVLISTHSGAAMCLASDYVGFPLDQIEEVMKRMLDSRILILEINKDNAIVVENGLFS